MNLLIVEDEIPAMQRIVKLVKEISPDANIVATTDSIESAVEAISMYPQIELALMDIELADGQSFDIFHKTAVLFPVIFTTAYDEFALKAFKVNSIDYLLKPIDKNELKTAFDKFYKASKKPQIDMQLQIQELMKQLKADEVNYKNRFLIKTGTKLVSVAADDILYLHASEKLVYLHTNKGNKFVMDQTLDELSRLLHPDKFFQLNRQYIAAIHAIKAVHQYFNGKLKIELLGALEEEIIVSRERAPEFKQWMGQ
jgi:DNA-binding LytR/AlgR family response regulator